MLQMYNIYQIYCIFADKAFLPSVIRPMSRKICEKDNVRYSNYEML